MAENSEISWTDHTFNPWMGCTKISDGCKFCYAETLMDKRYGKVQWGPQGTRIRTSDANWKKPLQWNRQAAKEGRRYRVFCASLADVFEDRLELAPWRADLFDLIAKTPNLDWLLLTKRPESIMPMLIAAGRGFQDLPDHLWIGTSVEDQDAADKRIPELLKVPARVRFLSCEPLLGPVNLSPWMTSCWQHEKAEWMLRRWGSSQPISWVIVGGESGHSARPMHPQWARGLRDQCQAAGVAFHFKQHGEFIARSQLKMQQIADLPNRPYRNAKPIDGDQVYQVGKHAAGRLLDGRTWDEFPEV